MSGTPLIAGVVALAVAVFVLMVIVGIIMMYYCRETNACSCFERCFKRPTFAMNNLTNLPNSYQLRVHGDSFDIGGDYVENISNTVTNQTQFGDTFVTNATKSNIITNNTKRAGRTYDRTKVFRENYHKTTVPRQTEPSDSTYDHMINQNDMYDVTYQTRSKLQDSVYNHAKGLSETYDVTDQRDHAAFEANTYDCTKNTTGIGRR